MKIAIAAATGNIGSRAARKIAAAGAQPILLGRDVDKLEKLRINGAINAVADLSDAGAVTKATANAEALLWLVPPTFAVSSLKEWYEKVTAAGVAAVRANRIKRVVAISSVGAGSRDDAGTVSYVGETERAFRQLDINFVALRPGYFMENFLQQTEAINNNDYFAFPFAPDHSIPFVSTDDIGDVAAAYLLDDKWAGQWTRNLLGAENLTLTAAAKILSDVLQKPIRYRRTTIAEVEKALTRAGASPTVRGEMIQLFRALGDPNGIYATARTFEATTPTTFERFARNKLLRE